MKENRVFADAFNYLLYNGQQMIQPEKLREIDTIEMAILQGGDQKHQDSETVQKYRDILKKTVVKEDGETVYLLLGVENQTDIHYAMPVRNLIYDALQYGKQVSDITAENRKTGKKRSGGEYLSGFYKEDKLTPVITLVIHFGTELWDGPESLHEMLRVNDKKNTGLYSGLSNSSDRSRTFDKRAAGTVSDESSRSAGMHKICKR